MQKWILGLAALWWGLSTQAAPVITASGGTWAPGQSVTILIQSSEGLPDNQGFLFDLGYDSDVLAYDSFSYGPRFAQWSGDVVDVDIDLSDNDGALSGFFFFADLSPANSPLLPGDTTLLGLHFTVKDPAFRGDTPVSLSCLHSDPDDPSSPCLDVAFDPLQLAVRVEPRDNSIPTPASLPLCATAGALLWMVRRRTAATSPAAR